MSLRLPPGKFGVGTDQLALLWAASATTPSLSGGRSLVAHIRRPLDMLDELSNPRIRDLGQVRGWSGPFRKLTGSKLLSDRRPGSDQTVPLSACLGTEPAVDGPGVETPPAEGVLQVLEEANDDEILLVLSAVREDGFDLGEDRSEMVCTFAGVRLGDRDR
jgi:hypothetical protein